MARTSRPIEAGTLPGYMPEGRAKKFFRELFGLKRRLSVTEEGNMLLTGRTRRELAKMTPEQLAEQADAVADESDVLLGS